MNIEAKWQMATTRIKAVSPVLLKTHPGHARNYHDTSHSGPLYILLLGGGVCLGTLGGLELFTQLLQNMAMPNLAMEVIEYALNSK